MLKVTRFAAGARRGNKKCRRERENADEYGTDAVAKLRLGKLFLRQKKWQSCKDSNLNKVNQNHLCYRYTTGLRIFYFVVLSNITAFRNKASSNFNFFQTFQLKIA